jgi:hypothetical protein
MRSPLKKKSKNVQNVQNEQNSLGTGHPIQPQSQQLILNMF